MESKDYLKDITEIKNLMNKSSRFISLSGLSGVLAGIYALIGAVIAHGIIRDIRAEYSGIKRLFLTLDALDSLFLVAFTVVVLSVITCVYLSTKKARKTNDTIWNKTSKRMLINFLIPLVTGGIFCIVLIDKNYFDLVAPTTLIFYGLSCLNASKYTLSDIRYLGVCNIILGLIATQFPGYGLYFWAVGFGVFHIIYGSLMYLKYDKN